MGRTISAVVAGWVAAWLTIMLCEFVATALYPPPAGANLADPAQLAAHIRSAPGASMLLVVAGWALGAFGGGLVAASISHPHRTRAALAVGAFVLLGVIANSVTIPHPLWMTVAGLILPLPLSGLAARIAARRAQ